MTRTFALLGLTACIFLHIAAPSVSWAESASQIIRGRVRDADTDSPIAGAVIALANGAVATISNAQGEYRLVLNQEESGRIGIRASHVGYQSQRKEISLTGATLALQVDFALQQAQQPVAPVVVPGGDAFHIVSRALARVPKNYPNREEALVGFYREGIRRGGNYVSLVECVLGINKASYASMQADHARLHVGRRGTDLKPQDTVALQYQGGITSALLLDVAKNPHMLFENISSGIRFLLVGRTTIDGRTLHVVHFEPVARNSEELQYTGHMHIDTASYALRSIHFDLLLEDGSPAASVLIRRQPRKVRVHNIHAHYDVEYRADADTIRLAYTKLQLEFTCKRRYSLFSRKYTITSELAITNRSQQPVRPIPRRDRISSSDVLAERVEAFEDPAFWEGYTTIEPDESIRSAVSRLARRMRRL